MCFEIAYSLSSLGYIPVVNPIIKVLFSKRIYSELCLWQSLSNKRRKLIREALCYVFCSMSHCPSKTKSCHKFEIYFSRMVTQDSDSQVHFTMTPEEAVLYVIEREENKTDVSMLRVKLAQLIIENPDC